MYRRLIVPFMFLMLATVAVAEVPFARMPGLAAIVIWEKTGPGDPHPITFHPGDPRLSVRLEDPLSEGNCDFTGAPGMEFYDLFFSDADGTLNPAGSHLTIECRFDPGPPKGGALNVSDVELQFSRQTLEYKLFVASYHAAGGNTRGGSVPYALDNDRGTYTVLGSSWEGKRLRLTIGLEIPFS